MHIQERMRHRLEFLYGVDRATTVFERIQNLAQTFLSSASTEAPQSTALKVDHRDSMLICYGDHVHRPGEAPLRTLHDFLRQTIHPTISSVHILPFYPYTSDDGFSVVDYLAVNPDLGGWNDIEHLRSDFRLMFDAVFNHISSKSAWFQGFLKDQPPYAHYFHVVDPSLDLSIVTRPRTHPLLSPFETPSGIKHVWTTFSADQIDVNASNPDVLVELLNALLFYVRQGASYIRLDAIAFLWKEIGTTCIHLPQTHVIIQLMRDLLDWVAPDVILITETNVPHVENISYFGDGTNEAQMVYQFSLPPLTLHTFHTGDTSALTRWAKTIHRLSERTTFFNFLASHDGIGVRPAVGLISDAEVDALVQRTLAHGGRVSYKNNPDGSQSPYEMNITYFDAITDPAITERDPQVAVKRFLCSQAIMLAMIGIPGIYFHSLFGSRNWTDGVRQLGHNRAINRQKLDADSLLHELHEPNSLRNAVFSGYMALLRARTASTAFHPLGDQRVLELETGVFALERVSPDGKVRVLALHNVTDRAIALSLSSPSRDLLSQQRFNSSITLAPYQAAWLQAEL
jgi:sucrose phosphorylase